MKKTVLALIIITTILIVLLPTIAAHDDHEATGQAEPEKETPEKEEEPHEEARKPPEEKPPEKKEKTTPPRGGVRVGVFPAERAEEETKKPQEEQKKTSEQKKKYAVFQDKKGEKIFYDLRMYEPDAKVPEDAISLSREQAELLSTQSGFANKVEITDSTIKVSYTIDGKEKLRIEKPYGETKFFVNNQETTKEEAREAFKEWLYETQPLTTILGFFPGPSEIRFFYRAYKGMSGWSSLVFGEEYLQDWKEKVNNLFCNILGIGIRGECWQSKICERYADLDTSSGVLYAQTTISAEPRAFAHIEGERSQPIETPEGTLYVYKITFGLSNPEEETITYRVELRKGSKGEVLVGPARLPKGQTASAIGAEAIVKELTTKYDSACLFFDSIRTLEGSTASRLCNTLVVPQTPTEFGIE